MTLKPGTWVKIYRKPISERNFEGIAELQNQVSDVGNNGITGWLVRFDGTYVSVRAVNEAHIVRRSERMKYLCPFCGKNGHPSRYYRLEDDPDEERHFIVCGQCGARGPLASTQEEAWQLWQQRTK